MNPRKLAKVLRWIARAWSVLSVGFVLVIVIGEVVSPHAPRPTVEEMVGMALFPVGVMIGLFLGWWREGLGGAIATVSLVGFYLWSYIVRGWLAGGPYFLLIAAPGFLFLALRALQRQAKSQGDEVQSGT
jgi:hypothetical protein